MLMAHEPWDEWLQVEQRLFRLLLVRVFPGAHSVGGLVDALIASSPTRRGPVASWRVLVVEI